MSAQSSHRRITHYCCSTNILHNEHILQLPGHVPVSLRLRYVCFQDTVLSYRITTLAGVRTLLQIRESKQEQFVELSINYQTVKPPRLSATSWPHSHPDTRPDVRPLVQQKVRHVSSFICQSLLHANKCISMLTMARRQSQKLWVLRTNQFLSHILFVAHNCTWNSTFFSSEQNCFFRRLYQFLLPKPSTRNTNFAKIKTDESGEWIRKRIWFLGWGYVSHQNVYSTASIIKFNIVSSTNYFLVKSFFYFSFLVSSLSFISLLYTLVTA